MRKGNLEMVELAPGKILEAILAARRERIRETRAQVPIDRVQQEAEIRHERRDFAAALSGGRTLGVPRVIAEMKQASPSAGLLRRNYRCREIAQGYEAAGAPAISVLTEEQFFRGSLTDLIDARDAVGLPVLRKDFILDSYQVYESVAAGADALLLIVSALEANELRELIELSHRSQITALVEVHTPEELDRALDAGARIIGVNNRNLKTLGVSLEVSLRLRERIPSHCLAVSESGIKTAQDLERLGRVGFDAVLIGEHLLRADDPGRALTEMLEAVAAPKVGRRDSRSAI